MLGWCVECGGAWGSAKVGARCHSLLRVTKASDVLFRLVPELGRDGFGDGLRVLLRACRGVLVTGQSDGKKGMELYTDGEGGEFDGGHGIATRLIKRDVEQGVQREAAGPGTIFF